MTENQNNMTPEEILSKVFFDDCIDEEPERLLTTKPYKAVITAMNLMFTAGVEAGKREQWYYDEDDIIRIVNFAWTAGLDKKERSVAMDYAQTLGQSKWIPVEEKIKSDQLVEVYAANSIRTERAFYSPAYDKFLNSEGEALKFIPTHYQVIILPSPPNPDKGGKEKES